MKRYSLPQKYIAFVFSCVFIFILTSQAVDAAGRSRVLPITLFASGMSLQFGSSFLKASAQNHYDTYLNAAIQADIQTHKDAFLARRNAGRIMSGVGLGCVGLAVLFSIYSQLDTPEPAESQLSSINGLPTPMEMSLTRLERSTNRLSENRSLLLPRRSFRLHPTYDFQTQRASLRLLHFF